MSESATKNASWTDREALIYLLSAIEFSNVKIDFANAPTPAGRNTSGCAQKMGKLKIAFRAEIDAIKNGDTAEAPAAKATPKKAAPRKRKVADGEDREASPKKRGRTKKKAVTKSASESANETEPEEKDVDLEV